ncbi:MAG: ABC-F family ATP-binding cassette domain-containing protein [Firmicutes bacterium]|nr:ABC-F family ATP-binding cassette domain-containing protein [Bacillota bacterium]
MMQIRNLKLTHHRDYRVLIDNLSFAVNPGDKIVIIGEEGEGKSTILKWIYDPRLIEDYAEALGDRIIQGDKIGYLPQELPQEELEETVYEFMCREPGFQEMNPGELSALTKTLGLPLDFLFENRKMKTLSGGEKIKVQFARILSARPTVLLLDEPSNDIDIETLEWLEEYIVKSKEGVLFVSHDETLIERTANRVIHIEQLSHKTLPRHTVANMRYREYVEKRLHGFELQESQAKMERRHQRIAEEKWRKIYQRVEHEQNVISRGDPSTGRLLKKKMHSVKAQGKRLEKQRQAMTEEPQYEREINLAFDYVPDIHSGKEVINLKLPLLLKPSAADADCGRVLAKGIDLQVYGRDKICITGRNGAGKTTLLKEIKKEISCRKGISYTYMPQNYEELLDLEKTPLEFLERDGSKEERVLINNRLASLRFTPDDMKRKIKELSGGQKGKLILLSLTLSGADVLILDEPTRNFSPLSGPVIRKMLAEFGGAIISVSHDRKYIDEVANKVYKLEEGGLRQVDQPFLCD